MCVNYLEFTYIFRIIFKILLIWGSSWSYATKDCRRSFSLTNPEKLLKRQEEIKNKYRQDQLINDVLTPVFVAGRDRISDILRITQKLKNKDMDPQKTHVPELAQLHQEYVNKVTQAVVADSNRTHKYFLEELNDFRSELEQVTHSARATYEWAIEYGFRLTLFVGHFLAGKVVDQKKKHRSHKKEAIQLTHGIMQVFPFKIFIPFPHSIGIILLNRTFPMNGYPMELSEQKVWADHNNMRPHVLYAHDGYHGLNKNVQFLDPAFNVSYGPKFHQFFYRIH